VTVAVVILGVVVAVLCLLVAGLLRSHALILRRLHEAGVDLDPNAVAPADGQTLPMADGAASHRHDPPETVRPNRAALGRRAHDIAGATPDGGALGVAVTAVEHDTVLLFLSSDCATCQRFWAVLGPDVPAPPVLPEGVRLVVVTKGPEREFPSAVAAHGARVPVVMSDQAWTDFEVPGSPYVVHVDGASGRVLGEGTGADWDQVTQLLARATGDLAFVGEAIAEQDTDAALMAAGVFPGDPSLYQRADGSWAGTPEPGSDA
jgi:hypothetical protein